MKDDLVILIAAAIELVLAFGLVCIGVLCFAVQFGFEWSFLLCVCVYLALIAAKWVFSQGD